MNILYHHRIASKDGQFVHIEEIITALCAQGHKVDLVGPAVHAQTDFGHDGGFVSKLKQKLPKWFYELAELGYSLIAALRLYKAIKKSRPDVIYERYNLYQPAGVIVAKMMKIPIILEVNAPLKEERERFSGGLGLPWLAKKIEDFTWKNADKVLPVTAVMAEHCYLSGVKKEDVEVIHNGIRRSAFDENREKSVAKNDEDPLIVGFVGFMHLTCGVEDAIEVIAEETQVNVKLVCVGDGNVLDSLKSKADELDVADRVQFTGLVGRQEIMRHVGRFDIALQPDVTEYASPLKMFEYMASKCLIVAPDKPNINEILSSETAILFNKGKDGFKDALREAITNYELHKSKRDSVYLSIEDKSFIWEENARKIVNIAAELKG